MQAGGLSSAAAWESSCRVNAGLVKRTVVLLGLHGLHPPKKYAPLSFLQIAFRSAVVPVLGV